MSGHCVADCLDTEFQRDEVNMECLCMDDTTMYFKWFYEESSSTDEAAAVAVEPTSGECTAIPNCTAGTQWHSHWGKCEYREVCSDKEHFDEE